MTALNRRSPVTFPARPAKTETRDNWSIVLEYDGEGEGPWIIDLSHRTRLDLQDANVGEITPHGVAVPAAPNRINLDGGVLVTRMNRTQATVWDLTKAGKAAPAEPCYTETTEGTVALAITGKKVFSILEKLTWLDLEDPANPAPFLIQGPFSHVPCPLVVLEREGKDGTLLVTCSRGYGKDMVHTIMEAGQEFGLRPAGETRLLDSLPAKAARTEAETAPAAEAPAAETA